MCSICHSRLIHSFSTSKAMLTTLFLVISLLFYTSLLTLCQSSEVQQGAEINLFLQSTMVYLKLSNYLLRINSFPEIELLGLGLACILRLLVEMEKLPSTQWCMKEPVSLYSDKRCAVFLLWSVNLFRRKKISPFAIVFTIEYQSFSSIDRLLLL